MKSRALLSENDIQFDNKFRISSPIIPSQSVQLLSHKNSYSSVAKVEKDSSICLVAQCCIAW